MAAEKLVVLGAGSVRCTVPVIASLGTFFGERPMEITLYDSDEERLDLFDRFARLFFTATKATHSLRSTYDPIEALVDADKVIVQIGENCARKLIGVPRTAPDPTEQALEHVLANLPPHVEVMSLMLDRNLPLYEYREMDWPPEPTEAERRSLPHQVMRYLHGEEFLYDLIQQGAQSPLRPWLNMPVQRVA
jgi:hypothetical protein